MHKYRSITDTLSIAVSIAELGVGPEAFQFLNENEEAMTSRDKYYILRPEVSKGGFIRGRFLRVIEWTVISLRK